MRIHNRKLAQRITDFENRLREIRLKGNNMTHLERSSEIYMEQQISDDKVTLAAHGYDTHGRKVR